MKIEIVKEEKDYLEVRLLDGEDLGFANLIAQEMLASGSATFANASLDHPITTNPVLRVRAKDPKKEVLKAAEKVAKKLSELLPAGSPAVHAKKKKEKA